MRVERPTILDSISVAILAKNSGATLKETLNSLTSFSEVILLDNGSEDDTLSIAARYSNVTVAPSPFIGFGPLRNRAALLARNDWILAIDSDEILSPLLVEEIAQIEFQPNSVYSIPRRNFYNQKQIKGCGWHPERVIRLYNKKSHSYSNALVHESLQKDSASVVYLKNPLLHTPYRTTSDFLRKMEHYSTLFAQQNRGLKKSSCLIAIGHALFAFFKSYILKRGIFDGAEGFIISWYNANTAFYKYIKLAKDYTRST